MSTLLKKKKIQKSLPYKTISHKHQQVHKVKMISLILRPASPKFHKCNYTMWHTIDSTLMVFSDNWMGTPTLSKKFYESISVRYLFVKNLSMYQAPCIFHEAQIMWVTWPSSPKISFAPEMLLLTYFVARSCTLHEIINSTSRKLFHYLLE